MDTFTQLQKQLSSNPSTTEEFLPGLTQRSVQNSISSPPDLKEGLDLQNVSGKEMFDLKNDFPSLPVSLNLNVVSDAWISRVNASSKPASLQNQKGASTLRFELPLHLQAKNKDLLGSKTFALNIIKSIKQKTKTNIEISTSTKTGTMTFIVSGSAENINNAKRLIENSFGLQVNETLRIPVSARPFIVGTGGKNLKSLIAKTMAKISIPRNENEAADIDPDSEQIITVSGDFEGVKMACAEIEALVALKTARKTIRIAIERSFHPFIKIGLENLQIETETKVIFAPWTSVEGAEGSRCVNEVEITGSKNGVASAQQKIIELYENLKLSTKSIVIPISKKQHRFIIGAKGSGLSEIMETTGCYVEVPSQSDPNDVITIRGPETSLGLALNLVLQKSSSVSASEIDLLKIIPSYIDLANFMKYILSRERNSIKAIETETTASILIPRATSNTIIDIQASNVVAVESAKSQFVALLQKTARDLHLGTFEIPRHFLKYVIGKAGTGLMKIKNNPEWNGRLLDIVCPSESKESDEILAAVTKLSNLEGTESEKEAASFLVRVQKSILDNVTAIADFTSKTLLVDPLYCGKIIGQGGNALKDLLLPYDGKVLARFNYSKSDKSIQAEVVLRGSSKEVNRLSAELTKLIAEFKHNDIMNSFSKKITVPKNTGKKLVNGGDLGGNGISWLVKSIKEVSDALSERDHTKVLEKDITAYNMNLKIQLSENDAVDDVLTLVGPKQVVNIAAPILENRSAVLKDMSTIIFNVFKSVSSKAVEILAQCYNSRDLKIRVLKRICGKECRNIKRFGDKHSVHIIMKNESTTSSDDVDLSADPLREIFSIKGLRSDVEIVKNEIIQQADHEIFHSFTESFQIAKPLVARIVGKGGARLQDLVRGIDARVDLHEEDEPGLVKIILEGTEAGVTQLRKKIEEIVDDMKNTVTTQVDIPIYLHNKIIGPKGSNIASIIKKFGGPEKAKIKFQKNQSIIQISSNERIIKQIKDALYELMENIILPNRELIDGYSEISFNIPKSDISRIVGRRWETLKNIMCTHDVSIFIDDESNSQADAMVHIFAETGSELNMENAKADIMSKIRASVRVDMPQKFSMIEEKNKEVMSLHLQDFAKKIKMRHNVQIDFETQHANILGEEGNIAAAAEEIKCHFLWEIDSPSPSILKLPKDMKQHIIGRGGATIKQLKGDSSIDIQIYTTSENNDYVFIHGPCSREIKEVCDKVETIIQSQLEISQRNQVKVVENALQNIIDVSPTHKPEITTIEYNRPKTIPGWSKPKAAPIINTEYGSGSAGLPNSEISIAKSPPQWTEKSRRQKRENGVGVQDVAILNTTNSPIIEPILTQVDPQARDSKSTEKVTERGIASKKKKRQNKNTFSDETPSNDPVISGITISIPSNQTSVVEIRTEDNLIIPTNAILNTSPIFIDSEPLEDEWTSVSSSNKKISKQGPLNSSGPSKTLNSHSVQLAAIALGIDSPQKKKKKKKKKKSATKNQSNPTEETNDDE